MSAYHHKMNWQERARRAEMLAEQLAVNLDLLSTRVAMMNWQDRNPTGSALIQPCREAIEAWGRHRADLDTLDQAQQEAK